MIVKSILVLRSNEQADRYTYPTIQVGFFFSSEKRVEKTLFSRKNTIPHKNKTIIISAILNRKDCREYFVLPVRLSARQASRYYARPYTARKRAAKTFSMRIRRKQRGIEPAGE